MKRSVIAPCYWLGVLLLWELNLHWTAFSGLSRFLPGLAFTLAVGALLTALVNLPGWTGRVFGWILPPVLALVYVVQLVYYEIFGSFLSLAFVSMGGEAITGFYTVMLSAIWRRLPQLVLILAPLPVFYILRAKGIFSRDGFPWKILAGFALSAVLLFTGTVLALPTKEDDPNRSGNLFRNSAATIDRWAEHFGILTAEALDLNRQGKGVVPVFNAEFNEAAAVAYPEKWNMLPEMDFETLNTMTDDPSLQALNDYFASLAPTKKNAYTGMFEGYNLIVICAEAFSNYVIDPQLTPTLYRMSREGIVFENFYNSFPNLTTNGEYSLCMGLMPDLSRMSFAVSTENYLPFAFGNICAENGMTALAYHNNVGTFYNRVNTHANMGYDFRAVDFGLDMEPGTPASDLEMIVETMDDYLSAEPFHAYYMTYSGHADYDFETNDMAIKNQKQVENLSGSEAVKAYIACQMELDRALSHLLSRLEEEGLADRTLVVLTGDHMPYGLPEEAYAELAGDEAVKEPFWQYKNSFICWTGGLEEPIVVEDYCCTMDVLPTVLNLLGLTYDSRLLTGRDVLSDGVHMALLKDGSFLTADVVYDANIGAFSWIGEEDPEQGGKLVQYASDQFMVSAAILASDYYDFAFRSLDLSLGREDHETVSSYADTAGTWYEQAVELLTTYGALSGGSTGAFNGMQTATRADFVAMVTRAKGLGGSDGSHVFSDVEEDVWYHDILSAAVEAKLISRAKKFRPTDPITQKEAQTILGRACEGEWIESAVADVVRKQKEEGYGGPKDSLSRGAAAWLVASLMDADKLEPLTFAPEPPPAPEPQYQPAPAPEPEPEPEEEEVRLTPPPDPLAGG